MLVGSRAGVDPSDVAQRAATEEEPIKRDKEEERESQRLPSQLQQKFCRTEFPGAPAPISSDAQETHFIASTLGPAQEKEKKRRKEEEGEGEEEEEKEEEGQEEEQEEEEEKDSGPERQSL
ncbi:hypothetical protein K0M31_010537 [Melipona bicolor]|uniref:Uncharacterized protein n=1 Tax=Melipona bicolor TaxID=60889 RepID=A0AA40FLG1_9HYME|nr:hypothetical protein K0M31_010537 [Melipona bicolor]